MNLPQSGGPFKGVWLDANWAHLDPTGDTFDGVLLDKDGEVVAAFSTSSDAQSVAEALNTTPDQRIAALVEALEDERRWRNAVTAYLFESLGEDTALERISEFLVNEGMGPMKGWVTEEWYELHGRTPTQTDAALSKAYIQTPAEA